METVHSVPEPIAAAEHSVKKKAQTDPKQQKELTRKARGDGEDVGICAFNADN